LRSRFVFSQRCPLRSPCVYYLYGLEDSMILSRESPDCVEKFRDFKLLWSTSTFALRKTWVRAQSDSNILHWEINSYKILQWHLGTASQCPYGSQFRIPEKWVYCSFGRITLWALTFLLWINFSQHDISVLSR
jgi:hypothetical protein